MDIKTPIGIDCRVYVDRKHVKQRLGAARPWVVECSNGMKYRCRALTLIASYTRFDIKECPTLWLVTHEPVAMFDVEAMPLKL